MTCFAHFIPAKNEGPSHARIGAREVELQCGHMSSVNHLQVDDSVCQPLTGKNAILGHICGRRWAPLLHKSHPAFWFCLGTARWCRQNWPTHLGIAIDSRPTMSPLLSHRTGLEVSHDDGDDDDDVGCWCVLDSMVEWIQYVVVACAIWVEVGVAKDILLSPLVTNVVKILSLCWAFCCSISRNKHDAMECATEPCSAQQTHDHVLDCLHRWLALEPATQMGTLALEASELHARPRRRCEVERGWRITCKKGQQMVKDLQALEEKGQESGRYAERVKAKLRALNEKPSRGGELDGNGDAQHGQRKSTPTRSAESHASSILQPRFQVQ